MMIRNKYNNMSTDAMEKVIDNYYAAKGYEVNNIDEVLRKHNLSESFSRGIEMKIADALKLKEVR